MNIELIKKYVDAHQQSILRKELDYNYLLNGLIRYFKVVKTDNFSLYVNFCSMLEIDHKDTMKMAIVLEGILNYICAYTKNS